MYLCRGHHFRCTYVEAKGCYFNPFIYLPIYLPHETLALLVHPTRQIQCALYLLRHFHKVHAAAVSPQDAENDEHDGNDDDDVHVF